MSHKFSSRKFQKAKRGGGRHFSRDIAMRDRDGRLPPEEASSDEEEESEEEEEDQPRVQPGELPPNSDSEDDLVKPMNRSLNLGNTESAAPKPKTAEEIAAARKARRAKGKQGAQQAQQQKGAASDDSDANSDDDDDIANANRKKTTGIKLSELGAPREMSRREREAAEKAAARERYMKMHLAGKTDEAKADLSRLAQIRKQREAAAAARKAETEAKEAAQKAALEKSGKKGQR